VKADAVLGDDPLGEPNGKVTQSTRNSIALLVICYQRTHALNRSLEKINQCVFLLRFVSDKGLFLISNRSHFFSQKKSFV
jgi:hypothetical protein